MRQRRIEFRKIRFLSTLSLRRATRVTQRDKLHNSNFYPRSPCGERQWIPSNSPTLCYFYPRSPCGERPICLTVQHPGIQISIHALLAESDHFEITITDIDFNFYPRSPCGERPGAKSHDPGKVLFLSTLSLRRATERRSNKYAPCHISIHALLAESDAYGRINDISRLIFLSTLSLRRATL